MEDRSYRCTAGEMEEFMESKIWLDVLDELEEWLKDISFALEDVDASESELRVLQGDAQAIRRFTMIPSFIAQNIRVSEETKEKQGGVSDE